MSTPIASAFSGGGGPGTDMLNFELLGPDQDLGSKSSPVTVALPVFPRIFKLEKIFLTNYDYEANWWGTPDAVDIRLHDQHGVDLVNSTGYLQDGAGQIQTQAVLSYPSTLLCTFRYNNDGSPYYSTAMGLVLWLRGTWMN